ncbi:transposase [Paenibacillus sp. N4]|uniref:RNA-guided endonuclease InsQ/TnpB family protein n=1 Tax=Paenibacillus vietnamensis TaxID=2590547 RepID=UPI001CD1842A|nr:RNA-guided endonuclease TnpB family protein [Paenibacillus vietnamensis]MCA0758048.1 transposase [Paenibacillus vietnamensis]
MQRTYKFRLYPTKEEQENIHFALERCRFLYNRLLAERIDAYKQTGQSLTYYEQKATLPERKKYIPELKNVHSQVHQNVVERLDKAYQAFFRRVKTGEKAGFPRFKPESRYNSITYPQSGFTIEGKHLRLSKIGDVRIRLHRQPQGNIKTCTIMVKNGNYYACFSCEVENVPLPASEKQIGIDLGILRLAVTSDGERIGWNGLVQFVTYKAESAGRQVVQVNPYRTSQRCSNCGEIVKKSLAVRVHQCSCGYDADRDENAATNILKLALQDIS